MNAVDLDLMQHYKSHTAGSVFDMWESRRIWQINVPREAVAHDFLMHAILAVAAAHKIKNSSFGFLNYRDYASKHRNLALWSALPALREVSATNCHALFAFTSLIVLPVFAPPPSLDGTISPSPIKDLLDVLPLLRGVVTVLHSGKVLDWVSNGDLGPLILSRRKWATQWAAADQFPLPLKFRDKFDQLRLLNDRHSPTTTEWESYDSSIESLQNAFRILNASYDDQTYNDTTSVLAWGAVIPDDFTMALRARKPSALVVLAHYGVLLHLGQHRWWSKGRGLELVQAMRQEPSEEWRPSISWPIEVTLRNDISLELACKLRFLSPQSQNRPSAAISDSTVERAPEGGRHAGRGGDLD